MKVFLDTDVCLDVLLNREPFHSTAEKLFSLAALDKIKVYVSALTFANAEHLLRVQYKVDGSRKILSSFKPVVHVLPMNEKIIELALASDFSDFEDAIQHSTATEHNIRILITRNIRDYRKATIEVMSPESFLARKF